jgi:hypothetical protein
MHPATIRKRPERSPRRVWGAALAAVLALAAVAALYGQQELGQQEIEGRRNPRLPSSAAIPAAEFSRIIQQFSEEGGYFQSDNFTSNETAYLHIVSRLREVGVKDGAYIGVGPEQNFTYIAKIRPRIAFIVDIRRQAVIQHLMYKAIFHQAETRAQFLAWLFSEPIPGKDALSKDVPVESLIEYVRITPATEEALQANLAAIRRTIEGEFRFPLSPEDLESLRYVYSAFYHGNLSISFRFGSRSYASAWRAGFPGLRDLILATDEDGNKGNFLASEADYQFVRTLHRQNRIIPVVGDFAGPKALASVAEYLRRNGYTVSAFYTSNVEQFLFGNDTYARFAENVRKLPIHENSVFIRAVRSGWDRHPAALPGHRMTPMLQRLSEFFQDFDDGLLTDYWNLTTRHYIPPREVSERLEQVPAP